MLMGISFIMMQVKSPMLVCVGMYLPLETTFAIFLGGIFKGLVDNIVEKRKFSAAQRINTDNTGVLLASGLIAGEALMGLIIAMFAVGEIFLYDIFSFFAKGPFLISIVVLIIIAAVLVVFPLRNAGKADAPVPPGAVM
jgi:hypothetical protein